MDFWDLYYPLTPYLVETRVFLLAQSNGMSDGKILVVGDNIEFVKVASIGSGKKRFSVLLS